MSHYTNPAFCQKSEFYPPVIPFNENNVSNDSTNFQSMRHLGIRVHQRPLQRKINQRQLPPKPEPKAIKFSINTEHTAEDALYKYQISKSKINTDGYALVPLDELPTTSKNRYAVLPASEAHMLHSSSFRLSKSQDNLDFDFTETAHEDEDSFTSLPVFTTLVDNRKLVPAFSSDFINKSLVMAEQNSMQRYTIIPTDDDEDVVDSNHEIIEMCNGRAHRYAVIPTNDDESCMPVEFAARPSKLNKSQSFDDGPIQKKTMRHEIAPKTKSVFKSEQGYSGTGMDRRIRSSFNVKVQSDMQIEKPLREMPNTPTKNLNATQKLHELLSTPRKYEPERLQRYGSYQTIIQRSPNQIQLHQMTTTQNRPEFIPQKLTYENRPTLPQDNEHRTTAIISPRLHQQMAFSEANLCNDKQWPHESFQKVENATATIGIISLMLILSGILNSGLCLYMVTDMRRSFYLDFGIISGFAAAALGTMGFRSRQCYWLPNRHYISGYILVTVFSLLNCCGLLSLLWLDPYPGTPFHELISGVILALSTLILLLISLGVITSKWCIAPPPDNRVDVF